MVPDNLCAGGGGQGDVADEERGLASARHNPVAAERVKVSRVTRITACTCPTHSVPANPSPGANTSMQRTSSRERRFGSTVRAVSSGVAVSHSAATAQCNVGWLALTCAIR
jgi:hypothetical protein